jgi:epoxide hydrolase-like predicted phosphatase
MIKAIIFDWGGVLIDNPAPGYITYCAEHLKISKNELEKAFQKFHVGLQKGLISEERFWRQVCSELKIKNIPSHSLWEDAFKTAYSEKKDVFSMVSSLKRDGYKIALLSNTEMPMVDYFNERKYQFFDVAVFSCIEGVAKPDREIYEITLKRLDVQPQEAIFVDDRKEFVIGARNVGINAFLFKDVKQFREDLMRLISNS